MEELTVTAHPLSAEGLAQAGLVVEGETLTRNLSANIGETLHRLPGVHNSSFGNAAGRPVIRGLSGPRVRIMEDRIDSLDVSVTSADHATTVDAFVADRIEVRKAQARCCMAPVPLAASSMCIPAVFPMTARTS